MTGKILISGLLVALAIALLKIGYYNSHEDSENKTTFFIKQHLTWRLQFSNIFATEGDAKLLNELRPDEREKVIDYCRYRLGIDTTLQTQAELDACNLR